MGLIQFLGPLHLLAAVAAEITAQALPRAGVVMVAPGAAVSYQMVLGQFLVVLGQQGRATTAALAPAMMKPTVLPVAVVALAIKAATLAVVVEMAEMELRLQ
jgi:hypothetical protein